MKRSVLLLTLAGCVFGSAAAAAEKPATKPGASTVLVQPVAVPVVINGRLANFIYITMRLTLAPNANADAIRAKEPFFRDALVRDAYRTPLQLAADPNQVNEPLLRKLVMAESARIVGAGVVTAVQVTRAQPQHFLPKPAPARPQGPAPVV